MAIEREGDVAEAMQVAKLRVAKLRFREPRLRVIRTQPATRNFRWVSSCMYVRMYTYLIYIKLK